LTATFKDSRGDVVQDIIGCYNSKQKVWKQLLCVGDKILFKTSVAEPEDEMNPQCPISSTSKTIKCFEMWVGLW